MQKKTIIPVPIFLAVFVACSSLTGDGDDGTIRVSGNIEMTEVKVSFKVSGKLVERTVTEGDRVEKDIVIARLDQEQLLRQRDQAQASLKAAQSQLAQLLTAIEFQKETVEGQIDSSRAELKVAEAQLAELEAGSRNQEIQQARARVEEARTQYEQASSDWERAQPLMKADDISRSQYDQFQARYSATKAQLRQAEEALALVEEGPRTEAITRARARVEQAKAALRLAEAQRIELKRRRQEVDTRKAEIERATANLAYIDTQLADTIARTPVGGIVLSKSAEVGEVLAAGTTVVTIADLEHPWLRGYINQRDLGHVKIGQQVKVTTDSFPGKIYEGRIGFVASEAEFTPKQIQTQEERIKLVYRIKIDIENPNQELKLNMPADAEIVTGE